MENKEKKKIGNTIFNSVDLKPEVSSVHLSEEKLPKNNNNNDNNKLDKKEEIEEKKGINNFKELKKFNTDRLMINNFWIELISKIGFNLSLIIFEILGLLIIPVIFSLLNLNFEDAKVWIKTFAKNIKIKWFFIYKLSQDFSVGFFCLTNFSHILKEKDKPLKFLIINLILALLFYAVSCIILKVIIEEFLFGSFIKKISELEIISKEAKDEFIKIIKDFQKITVQSFSNLLGNFNNNLDRFLIGSVYFTLFTTPECFKDKNILFFRLLSILPITYIIIGLIFRALYNTEKIILDSCVSPIFVGPKYSIYGFFITFLLFIKSIEKKYKIFDEEKNIIPSVFAKISSGIFAIFGLIELVIGLFFSSLSKIRLGYHYLMILCAPIMILYDYKKNYEIHINPCKKINFAIFINIFITILLSATVFILGLILCVTIISLFDKYIQPLIQFVIENIEFIFSLFELFYSWKKK